MSHSVIIKEAVKKYGDFTAIDHVSIEIKQGEFFTLLGPSGCGKTTLLRMIAGFNTVDGGEIYFDDHLINNVAAHKRDIGMVFQNYAIFPHLNVEENVAYGLKARKINKSEIEKRVREALEMVQISDLGRRKPNELSGGQQQRVALARAFVIEPGVLLMDEPLSNLDAKLRVQMRTTIKKLQRRLGITTIYVTHDQEEALAISDRIAVMNKGHIMQVGTPQEIYLNPANPFVAGFIGVSNFIKCNVKSSDGRAYLEFAGDYQMEMPLKGNYEGEGMLSARPEQMYFAEKGLPGRINFSVFLGDFVEYEVQLKSGQIIQVNEYAKEKRNLKKDGEEVFIAFNVDGISLYKSENQEVLTC